MMESSKNFVLSCGPHVVIKHRGNGKVSSPAAVGNAPPTIADVRLRRFCYVVEPQKRVLKCQITVVLQYLSAVSESKRDDVITVVLQHMSASNIFSIRLSHDKAKARA